VVLPATSVAERDGTYTNAERRVQRSRQARPAVGQSRPDWQIVQGVAQILAELSLRRGVGVRVTTNGAKSAGAVGVRVTTNGAKSAGAVAAPAAWDYATPAEVAAEIAERVPGYSGVTYQTLAATGTSGTWGRQVNEAVFYDGTSYENSEGVGIQLPSLIEGSKASLSLAMRPAPAPGDARPLLLLGLPLAYDGDPLLRGSLLERQVPQPYVALSRADAERQNIRSGDLVRLDSAAGELTMAARVVADLPAGVAVVPANLPGLSLAGVQTGPRTRVTLVKLVTG
jgi:NADH-quinone oxidoreductase subunit G